MLTIFYVWECARCSVAHVDIDRDCSAYNDPVICPPDGWESSKNENLDGQICLECLKKEEAGDDI